MQFFSDEFEVGSFAVHKVADNAYRTGGTANDRHLRVHEITIRMSTAEALSLAQVLITQVAEQSPDDLKKSGIEFERGPAQGGGE